MTVRVIRILEYVYLDHESAEEDQRKWNVPPNGSVKRGGGTYHMLGEKPKKSPEYIITSATMSPRTTKADETVPLLDNDPKFQLHDAVVEEGTGFCGQVEEYLSNGYIGWRDVHGGRHLTHEDKLSRRDR